MRVRASSVNGADVAIAGGTLKEMVEHDFPVALGRDFAGSVEQVGEGVGRYQVGDEVFGFLPHANPTVHEGSWTELIALPEDNFVAGKPRSLDVAQAGAAPLAAITALAALDALAPSEGEAVRERHPDGVDAILDVVSFTPPDSLLKEGGRLASPLGAAGEGPGRFNLVAQSTPENLQRLGELLDDGTLRVPIRESYELAHPGEALAAFQSRPGEARQAASAAAATWSVHRAGTRVRALICGSRASSVRARSGPD